VSTTRLGRDVLDASDPPIKMIWVERGNPVTQNPDTNTVLEAFRSVDLRVVVEQFMTDTAREADLVLPAKSMFEQSDVIGAYWHPYIQLKQKMLDPPGEVKPETEIYWYLSKRLGFARGDVERAIPAPSDEAVEAFLRRKLEPFPEITLERLADGPIVAPGHQAVAFSDFVFPTPSGRIELASNEAKERWGADPVPDFFEPAESARGERGDDRYPLYFMTPNTKNRIHSQFNNLQTILALSPSPALLIHPEDAAERGVSSGERVRVFNDRGELEVEARFDHGIKRGCVSLTNGWWITQGGTVNFLSLGRETDMGYGAAFHDNLVQVEQSG
jgi:anaerobic selenocysteine-containing dehydrogenase